MVSNPASFPPSADEVRTAAAAPWDWAEVWQQAGLCRQDKREWYPDSAADQRRLTSICQGCPVRRQCLTWALERGEYSGVWGGLTERELRKAAALTPQGTRRTSPGAKVTCPWCTGHDLVMVERHRVQCETCSFAWPGLVTNTRLRLVTA
jgi:WhiB family redox-sensing transcriptional regulator